MPRSPVRKRPQAIRDLADVAVYLADESGDDKLGVRFLDAAEASFEQLASMPGMGATRQYDDPDLEGVRMWAITGFPSHLIFYRQLGDGIEVIRVLHAKRDIEAILGGKS